MRGFISFITFCILISACSQQNSSEDKAVAATAGKELFAEKCSACHRPGENFVGPALKGAEKRWDDQKKLYAFIRNSQEVIARDAYAKQLYEKWGRAYMQPFTDLKDEEIKSILLYCEEN